MMMIMVMITIMTKIIMMVIMIITMTTSWQWWRDTYYNDNSEENDHIDDDYKDYFRNINNDDNSVSIDFTNNTCIVDVNDHNQDDNNYENENDYEHVDLNYLMQKMQLKITSLSSWIFFRLNCHQNC